MGKREKNTHTTTINTFLMRFNSSKFTRIDLSTERLTVQTYRNSSKIAWGCTNEVSVAQERPPGHTLVLLEVLPTRWQDELQLCSAAWALPPVSIGSTKLSPMLSWQGGCFSTHSGTKPSFFSATVTTSAISSVLSETQVHSTYKMETIEPSQNSLDFITN